MPLSYLWWLRGVTCYTSSFDNVNDPVIANFKPNIVKLCLLSLKSSLISLIKSNNVLIEKQPIHEILGTLIAISNTL